MNAIDKFDEMTSPFTDEEWPHMYLRVINDKRFALWGLSSKDILDVKFHLDCWNKTAQDLRNEVPR